MKKNKSISMEKKLEKKKEIERLSNKSLLIFSVALLSEMLLVLLVSLYNSTGAIRLHLESILLWFSAAAILVFIAFLITYFVLGKKGIKEKLRTRLLNWGYFSLAAGLAAFYVAPGKVLIWVFGLFGKSDTASLIISQISKFIGKNGLFILMIAIVIYIIASFIYFNIKIRNVKKSKI